nr:hypothetical protein [Tanacetum cinerariifolium]
MDQNIDFSGSDPIQTPQYPVAPILSTKEPEYSLSMGYERPNTTLETKSDEIIKSGVEELVLIPNECEIFSDFDNDDDISRDDDAFEDIEYVDASLPDPKIVSLEEENVVHQEEEEVDLEDIFQIQDIVLREKLLSINRLIANIESLNENPTPDCVLNSSTSIPIFEEFDNSLSDNFSPEFETFCDHTEETRSGSTITHADISLPDVDLFLAFDDSIPPGIENYGYDSEGDIRFLKELLIDDSIPFPVNESYNFNNDPSFPRPRPKPPDAKFDFDPDFGEVISAVMKNIDELNEDECFNPGGEIDVSTNDEDVDYSSFIFVIRIFLSYLIYPEVFPLFLSAESEDTIFDPGFTSQ